MKSKPWTPTSPDAASPDAASPDATSPPRPGATPREPPYGLAVALQAGFQLLVFASATLVWQRDRSALELASRDPGASALAALHVGSPLVAAVVAAVRRLRGQAPGAPAFWLLAMLELLKVIALLLAGGAVLMRRATTESVSLLAVGVALVALTGWPLVRGSRRVGWERWAHLQAAMAPWHLLVASLLLVEVGKRSPAPGLWLYLLAAPSLAPLYLWTLWPRRSLGFQRG